MRNNKFARKFTAISSAAVMALGTAVIAPISSASAAAEDPDNYAKLLQYSLYFYDANMCGTEVGETTRLKWRDDCHTSDAVIGGFHDAGDHVKFGLPAGFSASTLGWSYYEFGDAFDSTGQTAHLRTITDYFARYFKDSTALNGDTVTNFVYQIGNGDADHAEWCAPEVQGTSSRRTYSTKNGASDIAAEYAAALAANYINFGNEEDLKYAKALFEFSTKYNRCATDGTTGFYYNSAWSDYKDEQGWAAGWLYLATKDDQYKSFLNKYITSNCQYGVYTTYSWDNVSVGAAVLQAEITGSSSDWNRVTQFLKSKGTNSDKYYFEMQWGSARYNSAQQLTALVASKYPAANVNFKKWAKGQMNYILGDNPANTCFVVGFANNSAKYPHHRGASGYSNMGELGGKTAYSSSGHTLTKA